MKKKLLLLFTMVILAFSLTSCSKPSTIEEFYTRPAYQAALDEQMESFRTAYSSMYSDIDYELSGNTFTYTYTLATQIDDVEGAKQTLESSLSASDVSSAIDDMEEETGITGITVEYVYYNNDGSEIFRKSFTN